MTKEDAQAMDDEAIIELYWARSENAIRETDAKYGKLCRYIAKNILANPQDEEECINDTFFGVWNAIPPQRPSKFSAFIGRIARNLALSEKVISRQWAQLTIEPLTRN